MVEKTIYFILKGIARLPLRILYGLSGLIYFVIYHLLHYRIKVVKQNLREAFPEKDEKEIHAIAKEYYRFLSEVVVETIKLLAISDEELAKRVEVVNPEIVNSRVGEGKSVVIMLGHYGNWEWVQEISRYIDDSTYKATIYHPLKNGMWDRIYQRIRGRWGAHLLPMKRAPRALISKENQPWVCGFIADHRPRSNNGENIVEILNHYTSVIYGPEEIGNKLEAAFVFLEMERIKRGKYRITFHELTPEDGENPYPYTRAFWKAFEQAVRKNPSLWMWSHKRWKNDRIMPSKQ